jgi:hypothetical protein
VVPCVYHIKQYKEKAHMELHDMELLELAKANDLDDESDDEEDLANSAGNARADPGGDPARLVPCCWTIGHI